MTEIDLITYLADRATYEATRRTLGIAEESRAGYVKDAATTVQYRRSRDREDAVAYAAEQAAASAAATSLSPPIA